MADIDVDTAEDGGGEAKPKPKPKPKPPKPAGGGGGGNNMMSIITAAIAVAAIVVCGLLAWQVMSLQAKLGDANIKTPAGLGGDEEAAAEGEGEDGHGGGHGASADGEYQGGWEDDPVDFKFPMAKFTAKTSDGKAAVMTLALKATSGVTFRDMQQHEADLKHHEILMYKYNEQLEKFFKENEHALAPADRVYGRFTRDDLVLGGFFLMHGGPAATEYPELPVPPEPPKTILEQKVLEREDEVREVIIDEINEMTASALNTKAGRDIFKTRVIDRLNVMFDRYLGVFTGIVVSEIIST